MNREAAARGRLARFGPTETEGVRGSPIAPQSTPTSKAARMAARRFMVPLRVQTLEVPPTHEPKPELV